MLSVTPGELRLGAGGQQGAGQPLGLALRNRPSPAADTISGKAGPLALHLSGARLESSSPCWWAGGVCLWPWRCGLVTCGRGPGHSQLCPLLPPARAEAPAGPSSEAPTPAPHSL